MVLLLHPPDVFHRLTPGHARDGKDEEAQVEEAEENDQRERAERKAQAAREADY